MLTIVGGPKVLKHFADHTLFLCYPDGIKGLTLRCVCDSFPKDFEDTDESLALSCLEYYTGYATMSFSDAVNPYLTTVIC